MVSSLPTFQRNLTAVILRVRESHTEQCRAE